MVLNLLWNFYMSTRITEESFSILKILLLISLLTIHKKYCNFFVIRLNAFTFSFNTFFLTKVFVEAYTNTTVA